MVNSKNRDIVIGGYKSSSETPILTIRETEAFKTYLTLLEKQVSIAIVKHGQRKATVLEKQVIKEKTQNLDFEFDPEVDHKVWCKISLFAIAPDLDPAKETLKIERQTYKALELIDLENNKNWQFDWATTWLVLEDESQLTLDGLLKTVVSRFGVKYTNVISTNKELKLAIIDSEQSFTNALTLSKAITAAKGEKEKIELKVDVRDIIEGEITPLSVEKQCKTYLQNKQYQLPIKRELLNISAYVGRT